MAFDTVRFLETFSRISARRASRLPTRHLLRTLEPYAKPSSESESPLVRTLLRSVCCHTAPYPCTQHIQFQQPPNPQLNLHSPLFRVVKTVLLANGHFAGVTPAIFVIFVDFRGPRSKIPRFCGQNATSEFSPIFVKTTCFRQGTKRPFSKTTVSTTLIFE